MVLAAMRDKAKHGIRGQDSETGTSPQPVSLVIVSPGTKSSSDAKKYIRNLSNNKIHKKLISILNFLKAQLIAKDVKKNICTKN